MCVRATCTVHKIIKCSRILCQISRRHIPPEFRTNLQVTVAGGVVHDEGEVSLAVGQLVEPRPELAHAPLRLIRGRVTVGASSPL